MHPEADGQLIEDGALSTLSWHTRLAGLGLAVCALASGCATTPDTPPDRSTLAGIERLYDNTPSDHCDFEYLRQMDPAGVSDYAAKCVGEQNGPIALVNFSTTSPDDLAAIAADVQHSLPILTRGVNQQHVEVIPASSEAKQAAQQALAGSPCVDAPEYYPAAKFASVAAQETMPWLTNFAEVIALTDKEFCDGAGGKADFVHLRYADITTRQPDWLSHEQLLKVLAGAIKHERIHLDGVDHESLVKLCLAACMAGGPYADFLKGADFGGQRVLNIAQLIRNGYYYDTYGGTSVMGGAKDSSQPDAALVPAQQDMLNLPGNIVANRLPLSQLLEDKQLSFSAQDAANLRYAKTMLDGPIYLYASGKLFEGDPAKHFYWLTVTPHTETNSSNSDAITSADIGVISTLGDYATLATLAPARGDTGYFGIDVQDYNYAGHTNMVWLQFTGGRLLVSSTTN